MSTHEHYTSIAPHEDDHVAAMCGCALGRAEDGTVRYYQCALHAAAPALLSACNATYEHMADMGCECPTETTGHYAHCVLGRVDDAITKASLNANRRY